MRDPYPVVRCNNERCVAKKPSRSGEFPGTDLVLGKSIHLSGSPDLWLVCSWCMRRAEPVDQSPYIERMRQALIGLGV